MKNMQSDHPNKRAFWQAFKKLCNRLGLDPERTERVAQAEAWFDDFGREPVPVFVDAFEHMKSSKSFVPNYREFAEQMGAARGRVEVTTDAELCQLCDRTSWPVKSTGVIHLGKLPSGRYVHSRDAMLALDRPLRSSERLACACDRCSAGKRHSRSLPGLDSVQLDLDALAWAVEYHREPQLATDEALARVDAILHDLKTVRRESGKEITP